jgi:c-di-GMP-binding flagellar brake protein YcgR
MPKWPKKSQKKRTSIPKDDRLNPEKVEMRKKKEPDWAVQERRQESRINEEDKVVVELLTNGQIPGDKPIINALTKDISPGGARIMTNILIPVNTLLKLDIVLSQRRRRVHGTGIVRWSRTVYQDELFEMGVEFTQISPEDKMTLLEHTYRKRS